MRRIKQPSEPVWLIWEGDDFPRKLHSDSIVFYITEHVYLDDDDVAKSALAKQLRTEGITYTLGESYAAIKEGWISRAAYRFEDGDELYPIYCENDDPTADYDATFVEVPHID